MERLVHRKGASKRWQEGSEGPVSRNRRVHLRRSVLSDLAHLTVILINVCKDPKDKSIAPTFVRATPGSAINQDEKKDCPVIDLEKPPQDNALVGTVDKPKLILGPPKTDITLLK